MSLNHALRRSQHDFAILAPSWQAGLTGSKCMPKSLKNDDVESVNIIQTCEKLGLALSDNLGYIQDSPQTGNETQCAIRKSHITFRDFSNIWFGTLKIYQQQVNTLFRLSKDLFSRSSNYNIKGLEARKRKSSLTSHKLIKSRRLTSSESYGKTHLTVNYSQLLDDLEELTQENSQETMTENNQCIPGPITQYQIREITMREITFNLPDLIDEDSGFGEATHEELAEFFNFVGDNEVLNMKKTTVKRKKSFVQGSPIKKPCPANDSFFDEEHNENIPLNENILKTSPLKRSISPTHSLYNENKKIKNLTYNNDYKETDKIKKENVFYTENTTITKTCNFKTKRSNLIIDGCIKIDVSEIIEAMKTSELAANYPRKRTLKLYKNKKIISALKLLTSFNRRSLKLSLSLKQKIRLSREQFKRDYLNILREIFKSNFNEKWASEIYPQWVCFENEQLKQHKGQKLKHLNKSNRQEKFVIQPEVDISNFNEVWNGNMENLNNNEPMLTFSNNYMGMASIYEEWRPNGVVFKLLNLWRSNQTNTIAALTLFKLTKSQIDRALGFNSLLHLFKRRYVNLTHFPGSIDLQNILAGEAIEGNLLSKFE